MIQLADIDPDNWRLGLKVREDQKTYVSDSARILARLMPIGITEAAHLSFMTMRFRWVWACIMICRRWRVMISASYL